jgi:hypothetical protein
MSLYDMINSFFVFLSTWPVPSDTPSYAKPYGAVGNEVTCTLQGFFIQFTDLKVLYSGVLAVYYLLIFRYRWKKRSIVTAECVAHAFIFILAVVTSVSALPLQLYNNAFLWCWIAPLPIFCATDEVEGNCERGQKALIYRFAFYYAWQLTTWVVVLVAMSILYYTAWAQAHKMKKYASGGALAERNRQQVLRLSTYYILSYFITYVFPTIVRGLQWAGVVPRFWLYALVVIFSPMQGVWNAIVFLLPRYRANRKKHPDWKFGKSVKETLTRCLKSRDKSASDADYIDDQHLQASNAMTMIVQDSASKAATSNLVPGVAPN